ncbi:MAG: hypothetical protein OEY07_09560 [Gammaproteobacteria bacterium]|nr:hypothetical protein [Gammaproteobacteria bacterium]
MTEFAALSASRSYLSVAGQLMDLGWITGILPKEKFVAGAEDGCCL